MREVLHQTQLRRLELVEELYQSHTEWLDIAEIADKLETSPHNLRNDLNSIRDIGIEVETNPSQMRLIINESIPLENAYRYFNKESVALNIVEEVFKNPDHTTSSLADTLFVSPSTVSRYVDNLNEVLTETFGIRLEKRPYHFSGDEKSIRYFLSEFYAERYTIYDWPFAMIDEAFITDLLVFLTDLLNVPMTFASMQMVKMNISVAMTRTLQGFRIESNHSKIQAMYQIALDMHDFRRFQAEFKKHYDIELNMDFLEQLFSEYTGEYYYFNHDDFYMAQQANTYVNQSVTYLNLMLTNISSMHRLEIPNRKELIYHLHNTAHLDQFDTYVTPILFPRKRRFVEEVESMYPAFYQDIYRGLVGYRDFLERPVDENMLNHLIYTLCIFWETALSQLSATNAPIRVLVLSKYDHYHARYLASALKRCVGDIIKIDIYSKKHLDLGELEESDYDIMITNLSLQPIEGKCIVYVSNMMTVDELSIFYDYMIEILQKRWLDTSSTPVYTIPNLGYNFGSI
ncbi:M protein trans-acting positive regulator PRD domain-containing protein [Suicoccus acidiformans]|nr:M protein trans-acting positive regulator PRD domain-containing protein [Suicoccus acidiformans]